MTPERFYSTYIDLIKNILRKYRLVHYEIDELTQETFLKFYSAVQQRDIEDDNIKYLCSIAHNEAKMLLVKKNSQKRKATYVPLHKIENILLDQKGSPESKLLEKEKTNVMKKIYYQGTHTQILSLFHVENYSILEISERLNIHPNAVKSRLSRARKKLKLKYEMEY